MSFSYTITETEKENLPDGDVIADLVSVEDKIFNYNGKMNSAVVVGWDIIEPMEFMRREYETFYTGHSDPKKAAFGKWKFSVLCKQIAQLKTGETVTKENLIGKRAQLTIKNNIADNGKNYQNIVNRVLLPSKSNHESNINSINSDHPLNDDVPF